MFYGYVYIKVVYFVLEIQSTYRLINTYHVVYHRKTGP